MNEKQLGNALLQVDVPPATSTADPRQIAAEIIKRDRRRVRWLIGLTVLFWVLAGAGIFFVLHVVTWRIYPHEQKMMQDAAIGNLTLERIAELQAIEFEAAELCTQVVGAAFIALSLAFLCSILLILASRRATLHQINANLAEISEQLKSLQTTRLRE
jgi:hypothetical protein